MGQGLGASRVGAVVLAQVYGPGGMAALLRSGIIATEEHFLHTRHHSKTGSIRPQNESPWQILLSVLLIALGSEAPRSYLACPRPHSKGQSWDSNPGRPVLELALSIPSHAVSHSSLLFPVSSEGPFVGPPVLTAAV